MSASVELQDALHAMLVAAPRVAEMVGERVYDNVPDNRVYPYISFGASDFTGERSLCLDQRDETIQIDVWVKQLGAKRPCRQLVDAVVKALDDQEIELPNHSVVEMTVIMARVIDDPAPSVAHGVIQLTCLIDS